MLGKLVSERGLPTIGRLVPIAHQYLASGATMFFSATCQMGWFMILARYLGVNDFGALMVITASCSLAAVLCGMGAGDAMLRQTARDPRSFPTMLGHGLLVITVTGIVLSAIFVLVLRGLLAVQTSVSVGLFPLSLFAVTNIVVFALISYSQQIFLGLGALRQANLIEMGFSLVRFLSAAVACLWFGVTTLDAWAVWTAGAHLIMLAACIAMVKPLGLPAWQINRHELVLGFHYCTPPLLDLLRVNTDRIVLGIVVPASVLANYAVAARITRVSQLVVNSLNRIVYPRFASRKELGLCRVRKMAVVYLAAIISIASITAAGVYIVAPLLPKLLGEPYESVIFNLRLLCWLIVPLAVQTVPYDLLGAFDRHRERAHLYNGMSLAGAALTAIMIYSRGITGAFVAAYVVELGLAVGLWYLLLRLAQTETTELLVKGPSR